MCDAFSCFLFSLTRSIPLLPGIAQHGHGRYISLAYLESRRRREGRKGPVLSGSEVLLDNKAKRPAFLTFDSAFL